MSEIAKKLGSLRRPRLLISAARYGLVEYNRDRHLKRLIRRDVLPSPTSALGWLIEEEARLEDTRVEKIAEYSPARHIEVLVAIMAEARLLPRSSPRETP